jgi:hypothetical protein
VQIHFRHDGYRAHTADERHDTFGVLSIPRSLLERHGGRMLRPGEVVTLPGTRLRSTAYRWGFLLVPDDVLQDAGIVAVVNRGGAAAVRRGARHRRPRNGAHLGRPDQVACPPPG